MTGRGASIAGLVLALAAAMPGARAGDSPEADDWSRACSVPGAFSNRLDITSLVLPDSVTNIAPRAFFGCTSLTNVVASTNLISVKSEAFKGCAALESVELPAATLAVATNAFAQCPAISSVVVSGSRLLSQMFPDSCRSLVRVRVSADAGAVRSWFCDGCGSLASLEVAEGVTNLGARAFADCTSLVDVSLPQSLGILGNSVFSNCTALSSIELPGGIDTLGTLAFAGCSSLANVSLPADLRVVGASAFRGCGALRSLDFPSGVTNIMSYAAAECVSLENIVLPDAVAVVGAAAFMDCSGVTNVEVYTATTRVASNAFDRCTGILSATLSGAQTASKLFPDRYAAIGDYRIAADASSLCDGMFEGCLGMSDIEIPWSVESIGARAFYGCSNLVDSVMVPEQVSSIGDHAFAYCTGLKTVKYLCNAPEAQATIYVGTRRDLISCVLKVREGWTAETESTNDTVTVSLPARWPVSNAEQGRRLAWWKTSAMARVVFSSNDGTGASSSKWYLANGGRVISDFPDEPERDGYMFIGWFTAPYGGVELEEDTEVTTSMTCYAHWEREDAEDEEEDETDYDFRTPQTYTGYLVADESVAGLVEVNIARGVWRSGEDETNAVVKATLQVLGEGRKTAKGKLHSDASGEAAVSKSEDGLEFSVEGGILTGTFGDLAVYAVRNYFSESSYSRKHAALAAADDYGGTYGVALAAESDGGEGFAGFSLTIGARGRVKISGTMPDGARVSVSAQMLVADYVCCVPVFIPLYSGKKGGFAFLVSLADGEATFEGFSPWLGPDAAEKGTLTLADAGAVSGLEDGTHVFSADVSTLGTESEELDDSLSPDGTEFSVSGAAWKCPRPDKVKFIYDEGYETVSENGNPASLKLRYAAKTGLFKGSFKTFAVTESGRSSRRTATLAGVMVNGTGYGCASIGNRRYAPVSLE